MTFLERFELNECLKSSWNNWAVQSLKKVLLVKGESIPTSVKIPTISDRTWLFLVKFAIEPIHEALFHPNNYGFRSGQSIYEVQKAFLLNLSKDSFGYQKRVLRIDFTKAFLSFNRSYLIGKIRALRSIKLGIFRLFEKGFDLKFPKDGFVGSTFDSLISNIFLDGIETINSCCIHYGYQLLFLLKPMDNEVAIMKSLNIFVSNMGLNLDRISTSIIFTYEGFDFLGWHFSLSYRNFGEFYCLPSFSDYQLFVKRVKKIVNNSNYGSTVKASKLYPLIREWKLYHKYSNLVGSKYSLFFIKKRAFKVFNSESKQDFYSSKRLLDKCFCVLKFLDEDLRNSRVINSPFYGHIAFWIDSKSYESNYLKSFYNYNCFCIHCGMKTY